MHQQQLIPHLFRTEFHRITAVLCKRFGLDIVEMAEDIASETFLAAQESWPYKGIPENPAAWLYSVARHKAINYLRRNQLFDSKIAPHLASTSMLHDEPQIDWSATNIKDSQLGMMFAVCDPVIPPESQLALSLRLLCGFGIDEIATAFLTNKETINKRLARAKEKLRINRVKLRSPGSTMIDQRLPVVLTCLYLLFNEGYYSESNEETVRTDLCAEAMRLCSLLLQNEGTNLPSVNALYALMCFQASRLQARIGGPGEAVLYHDQDEGNWDPVLISRGGYHLHEASKGDQLTTYHLEASIAYWHTNKDDNSRKWENILQLFDLLLQIRYSPVAALNRIYAVSKVKGTAVAIAQVEELALNNNQFYHALLGALYKKVNTAKSRLHFEQALALVKTSSDKNILRQHIQELERLN